MKLIGALFVILTASSAFAEGECYFRLNDTDGTAVIMARGVLRACAQLNADGITLVCEPEKETESYFATPIVDDTIKFEGTTCERTESIKICVINPKVC